MSDPDSSGKPPPEATQTVAAEEVVAATPQVLPPPAPAPSEIVAPRSLPPASGASEPALPSFRAPQDITAFAEPAPAEKPKDERDVTAPLEHVVLPGQAPPARSVWTRPEPSHSPASEQATVLNVEPEPTTDEVAAARAVEKPADQTWIMPPDATRLDLNPPTPAPPEPVPPPRQVTPTPRAASRATQMVQPRASSSVPPPPGAPEAPPRAAAPRPPAPVSPPSGKRAGGSGTIGWVILSLILGMTLGGACVTCGPRADFDDDSRAFGSGPHVGVVELSGAISDGSAVVRTLKRFRDRGDIEAIVMRIESPGGAVAPSQEIFDAVRAAAEKKPVVASIGTTAASGGFWVAMGADWIVASPGSLTGSIGVITELPDLRELAKLARFDMRIFKTGPHKDIGNPLREVTPGDEAIFMNMLSDIYDQFVEVVATRRHLDTDYVRRYADGRVFTGRQAHNLGFVDELGGLDAAAKRALFMAEEKKAKDKSKVEHSKEEPTLIYPQKRQPGILRLLAEEAGEGAASGATHAADGFLDRLWSNLGARTELR
ncbi:MAG: signal peptide peptidase SppA [Myxococcota bacterium]